VAGFHEKTPLGFVRKVTDKRKAGNGQVVFSTRQARLTEVFARADFDTSLTLDESTVDRVKANRKSAEFNRLSPDSEVLKTLKEGPMRKSITGFCTNTEDSLCAQASIGPFFASISFVGKPKFQFRHFSNPIRPTTMRASVKLKRREAVGAIVDVIDGRVEEEAPEVIIPNARLGTFTVGPVPVSVFATGGLGTAAEVNSDMRIYREKTGKRKIGIRYDGNTYHGIDEDIGRQEIRKVFKAPGSLRADLEIYVIVEVDFRIGELIGPTVGAEPFGLLRAKLDSSFKWKILAGLRGTAGVNSGLGIPEIEPIDVAEFKTQILPPDGEWRYDQEPNVGGSFPTLVQPPSNVDGASTGCKRGITWESPPGLKNPRYHVYRSEEGFDSTLVEGAYIDGVRPTSAGNYANHYRVGKIRRATERSAISDTSFVENLCAIAETFSDVGQDIRQNTYQYRVTAIPKSQINSTGTDGSEGSESVVLSGGLPKISNLSAESGDGQVRLSWDEPDGERLLEGYMVYRYDRPFSAEATKSNDSGNRDDPGEYLLRLFEADEVPQEPPLVDDNDGIVRMENGTTFYYRVTPVVTPQASGPRSPEAREGEPSTLVEATPLPDPPDRP